MDVGSVSVGYHPRLFMFFPSGETESKRYFPEKVKMKYAKSERAKEIIVVTIALRLSRLRLVWR